MMSYKKFPNHTKTYVVEHNEGYGVVEAPYVPIGVAGEFDSEEEAKDFADKMKRENNSKHSIESSWIPNTYWVHVNTSSEEGKRIYEEYVKERDKRFTGIPNEKDYDKVEYEGETFYLKKNKYFD